MIFVSTLISWALLCNQRSVRIEDCVWVDRDCSLLILASSGLH